MFEKDQEVYTEEGACLLYECAAGENHVVKVDEDETPFLYIGQLSDKPFVKKQMEEATAELDLLKEEIKRHQNTLDNLVSLSEKHEELKLLVDFLEGRITHYIDSDYGYYRIHDINDTGTEKRYSNNWPSAVGLFSVPNTKQVDWKLNEYRCGNGKWYSIIPCRSESEAQDKVKAVLNEKIENWRSTGDEKGIASILDHNNQWLTAPSDWVKYNAVKDLAEVVRRKEYSQQILSDILKQEEELLKCLK